MNIPITIFKKDNQELKIFIDESPDSPRTWDNLGTIITWHKSYTLSDGETKETPEEFLKRAKEENLIFLPIFMYDHSGISLSTSQEYPYDDRWDAGQVGFIYVNPEKAKKEFNVKNITSKIKKQILESLRIEIKTYSQYLEGDICGFLLIKKVTCDSCKETREEFINSCWGFYGTDFKDNGLFESTEIKNIEEWIKIKPY